MKKLICILMAFLISFEVSASDYFDYLKSIGIVEVNVVSEARAHVQNTKTRTIKVSKGRYAILDFVGNGTIVIKSAGNIVELDYSQTDFLEQLSGKNGKTYMDWQRSRAKAEYEKKQ